MQQIYVQDVQVDNVTNSIIEYDANFIVLLPLTIITEDILAILQQTYLNVLVVEKPLSLKEDVKNLLNEDDEVNQVDTFNDTVTDENEVYKTNDETEPTNVYDFCTEDDPYIISKSVLEYNALYEFAYTLCFNLYKTNTLNYQYVQKFVYNDIVPKVAKCPYIYLAVGNLPQEVDRHITTEIGLKCLLLAYTILEQDKTQRSFFSSIDKRIEVSICIFALYISAISIERQINKIVDFTEEKAQEILFKVSVEMLEKKHFPKYIVEVVSNMRPYKSEATQVQYQQENNEIRIVANFLSLVNYYVQSIISKQSTPFQTIKTIINDKYNFSIQNIKLFTQSIGVIPVGSHVKLRNGCHAIIRRFTKDNSLFPEVHLVTDSQGNPQKSLIHTTTKKNEFNVTEVLSYESSVKMTEIYLHILKSKYQ